MKYRQEFVDWCSFHYYYPTDYRYEVFLKEKHNNQKIDKIRIIQQETSTSTGVQQHLRRPGTIKTFCGVKYTERKRWFDYGEDIILEDYHKWTTCSRCRLSTEKYIKDNNEN